MSTYALKIDGLHKRFGETIALDGIDLSLSCGEVLALLGPSGCGKTTLLRCIAGLVDIDTGEIHLENVCVAASGRHLSPDDRRLGMVFQDYALWPHMSIYQNVVFPLEMQGVTLNARLDEEGLAIADTHLPLRAACGYRGEVSLLLPRRALTLCTPEEGLLRAHITGRLFQGEHLSLQLQLENGSTLKMHVPHAPERGCLVGIEVDTTAIRAWKDVSTFVFGPFEQGSPGVGMAMSAVAILTTTALLVDLTAFSRKRLPIAG